MSNIPPLNKGAVVLVNWNDMPAFAVAILLQPMNADQTEWSALEISPDVRIIDNIQSSQVVLTGNKTLSVIADKVKETLRVFVCPTCERETIHVPIDKASTTSAELIAGSVCCTVCGHRRGS